MYIRPFRRRPHFAYSRTSETTGGEKRPFGFVLMLIAAFILVVIVSVFIFLRNVSSQIAVSDAKDAVISSINSALVEIMDEGNYPGGSFVSFEKSEDGSVTLISSNMAQINALSAELLSKVIGSTGNHKLMINIPAGNLTGISFLMGYGADIPVEVVALTSSRVEFSNSIISAGINQTKHQINLEVIVDLDIVIPWGIEEAKVVTQVLIADTVIVGHVPDTYLNVQ